jgi:predicted esterase
MKFDRSKPSFCCQSKLFRILMATATLLSAALLEGQVSTGQQIIEETTITNIDRYALYIPDSFNDEPNKKWPLMVTLHGTGGFADAATLEENIEILLSRSIPAQIDKGSTRFDEFIVLSPQAKAGKWWNGDEINTLVNQIIANYQIDTDRLIVTGQSMGGYGTYKTILNQPNKYAAAVPICPALTLNESNSQNIDHIPIWMHHGDADPTVNYNRSATNYNLLAALIGGSETTDTGAILGTSYTTQTTGNVSFTTYHGDNHDSWTETYARDEVIEYMYSHSLPSSNQPPVLTIHSPTLTNNIVIQGETTPLSLSATDPDGSIASCKVELDGAQIARADTDTVIANNIFSALDPGIYTLRVSAIDNEGREFAETRKIRVQLPPPSSGEDISIRLDFGEDNNAPKIGYVDGGSWNTIDDEMGDPNVDILVGDATTELKDTIGWGSGISIGNWIGVGSVLAETTNNQDVDDLDGTAFNNGNGDAGYDILNAISDGGSFGFTLSGFDISDTVTVRVAASSKKWSTNIADFTIDGTFATNGGDDFDIYANSQNSGSGNATILTWTRTGATSYDFLMAASANSRGAVNGMIIDIAPGALDTTAPAWASTYPKAGAAAPTSANLFAQIDENGTVYYVALTDGASAPTSTQIKAGTDASNTSVSLSGQQALTANTEVTVTVSGLSSLTAYDVYVVAEDVFGNLQATPSLIEITTPDADTSAPTPNAATWASAPSADSSTEISMTATTGFDPSGPVEYYFEETTGNTGGSDSGWQSSPAYTDAGLSPETQYSYVVRMRDAAGNTGNDSSTETATTPASPAVNAEIRIDFGTDGQANNIDVSNGRNWNTIAPVAASYDLKIGDGATGSDTGYDFSLSSGWANTSSNDIDITAYKNTVFDENGTLSEGAEFDTLRASSPGVAASFTISGFQTSDTLTIQLAAARKDGDISNLADFTFDGAFASNGGDNFDVYSNSQLTDGTGTILTWTLTGATTYTFTMDPADGATAGINGMIINISGGAVEPDSDNDGLTNSEEATAGTDPNDPDSDGDGLSDGKEVNELGTDPNSGNSRAGGMSDLLYYALNAESFASEGQSMPALIHADNAVEFNIPKTEASDIDYSIEISLNLSTWYRIAHKLSGAVWQKDNTDDATPAYPHIGDITLTPSTSGISISESEQSAPRFYRSRIESSL